MKIKKNLFQEFLSKSFKIFNRFFKKINFEIEMWLDLFFFHFPKFRKIKKLFSLSKKFEKLVQINF